MAVVVFDPEEFRTLQPKYASYADGILNWYFELACELVDNTEYSKIPYNPPSVNTRKIILYAIVCHLCELQRRGNGLVGTLTNATEGSVSAGVKPFTSANNEWWNQTQCGATAWMLMLRYVVGGRAYRGCFR